MSNSHAAYIEVRPEVRYWEDATVDGVEDTDGKLIPLRVGDDWCPVIRLSDGAIQNWPEGVEASVHYKVCDAGEYWLLDENRGRVAKSAGYYVPDSFLCHGDSGYGDYIIFNVGPNGKITGWVEPEVHPEDWIHLSNQPEAPAKRDKP